MMKKIDFHEIAAFIASDVTLDIFPDIVWPLDIKFSKDKINWLATELKQRYTLYKESPDDTDNTDEELSFETDSEDE